MIAIRYRISQKLMLLHAIASLQCLTPVKLNSSNNSQIYMRPGQVLMVMIVLSGRSQYRRGSSKVISLQNEERHRMNQTKKKRQRSKHTNTNNSQTRRGIMQVIHKYQ